jgi:tRNA A-37 threonylcarbamoyl transferase component Bud32
MEQAKEMVVDLENLKKEDFLAMAEYIQHLEGLIDAAIEKERELKAYAVTLANQRAAEHRRYLEYKSLYDRTQIGVVNVTPQAAKIEIHTTLTNPEQYREKKQF